MRKTGYPRRMPLWAAVIILVATTTGCDRPIQLQPEAIADAQLVVSVKTVLVNDPQLGPRVVEVRVVRGVVSLSGVVGSAAEADRAVDLARTVPGVTGVRSQLMVREPSELHAGTTDGESPDHHTPAADGVSASRRRLLAIGASLNTRRPRHDALASTLSAGPLLRLGTSSGFGPTFGFSWLRTDLSSASSPDPVGRITIRPMMVGVSYTLTDQAHWALSPSLVGGMAFNRLTLVESAARDTVAVDVDNSAALRPGMSLWLDLNSRVALNVFGGYLITRPQVTFLEDGRLAKHPLRADTGVINIGLAYKVF